MATSAETPAPAVARVTVSDTLPEGLQGTIVFHSDREGRSKLLTLDLPSRTVRALTSGTEHHDVEPAWAPDGRSVAFSSTRFDGRTFDLAVIEAGSATARRLTTDLAFDRHPAWSRDGRSLWYASERDGTQAVFRVQLDSGAVSRQSPAPERALMPAPAPDGARLAFVMGGPDGLQVVVQDLVSGAVTRVTSGPDAAAWPAWSPDGGRLACIRLRAGGGRLELRDSATGAIDAIAIDGLPELREPAWSPDGRFLVVSASASAGPTADFDLVLVVPGPSAAAIRLTAGRGSDGAPSWTIR